MTHDLAARGEAAPTPGPRAARAREAVTVALASCPAALAAWEGGSAAFGRADEASDLDIGVLCDDGAAEVVLDAIEQALARVVPELDVWRRGRAPFGFQRFLQPRGAAVEGAFCMVDASVIERDNHVDEWRELLLPERHGRALTIHDPAGVLEQARGAARFDVAAHRSAMVVALDRIRARRVLFAGFADKELQRGRPLDAHGFRESMVIAPLAALLGMVHRPLRWDFGMRYLHEELPTEASTRLATIVASAEVDAGIAWMDELLATVDPSTAPIEQHAAQMRAAFG